MATVVAPASQQKIDALPSTLQGEVLHCFETLAGLSNGEEWQQAEKQLQLIKVIAASPFSAQLFLLNPHLLDHAFLTSAF